MSLGLGVAGHGPGFSTKSYLEQPLRSLQNAN